MCSRRSATLRPLIFFFNDTATTEIYTLSLHDALPISAARFQGRAGRDRPRTGGPAHRRIRPPWASARQRSEEHTSELQSRLHLVCRLLLEKKKKPTRNQRVRPLQPCRDRTSRGRRLCL